MTKADLKPGYVLNTRWEGYYMVMPKGKGELCAVQKDGSWFSIEGEEDLADDLTDPCGFTGYDVMEVYGFSKFSSLSIDVTKECRPMLWKRSEPKKMTMEDVCQALGYDVEIVKEAPNA